MTLPAGAVAADTITKLPPDAWGSVVVCGSHGGRYPGVLAAAAGVRAVIFNDAGVGRDGAGVGSLPLLEAFGVAAATVCAQSCEIGSAADMLARGVVSHANAPARAAGVAAGLSCREAAERLASAPHARAGAVAHEEARSEAPAPGPRRIVLLDSASLVQPDDSGQIIVTGSHGGLIGGAPAMALRVDAFAAAFNDAGRPDGPGATRLPALDARGVAAITVSAASARIGEGASTFEDGIVSAANATASRLGAEGGAPARPLLERWSALP